MYKWFVAVLLLTVIAIVGGCGLSEDTVAKVGSETISKEEFIQALSRRFPNQDNYQQISKKEKMEVLDLMIEQKLKLNAALELDISDDEDYQQQYKQRKIQALGNKYFEREIVDQMITEEQLREHFDRQATEVKASHVLIGYKGLPRSKATRSQEEAEALAKEIAEKARAGESLADLAVQYSEDPSAQQNKGDLGYFTWGRMVPAFQEVAFSMNPGDISDPVLSDFGYHVILVEDKRPNPKHNPDDFENQLLNLKRSIYQTRAQEGRQLWDEHIAEMKNDKNFQLVTDNMDNMHTLILSKIDSGLFKGENFSTEEKETELARWKGGKTTLADLFDMFGNALTRQANRFRNKQQFQQDVENVSIQNMITTAAEGKGYDQEEDVRKQLDGFKEQRLLSLLNKEEVNDKVIIEDADVETYYQENREEFVRPEEIQIWEVYVKDEAQAKKVLRLAKSGSNFERLAEKYSEDKFFQKKKGNLGFKRENSRGTVSREAFKVGPNQIAGPVKYNRGWAVIKTGEKKPAEQQELSEVKSRVKSKLRSDRLRERKKEFEEELKDRFAIKINDDLLEQI